jgi:prepilin peptidase CpaA
MTEEDIQAAVAWLFPIAVVYAAVRDVVTYEVPNWIPMALAAVFAAVALWSGSGVDAVLWHFAAGAFVLVVGWALFNRGVFGGGDAKLLAASAVWVGWSGLAEFALAVALFGGALAAALLVVRRLKVPTAKAGGPRLRCLLSSDQGIPYCAAIALGGLWMFPAVKAGLPVN